MGLLSHVDGVLNIMRHIIRQIRNCDCLLFIYTNGTSYFDSNLTIN